MPDSSYDCIVIGSGPGGYVAAIRAAQLGMKTAVIEKDEVGGRCLNYACIPAKAVLRVADVLSEIREAGEFGIKVSEPEVDFAGVSARREKVIKTLTGGVSGLFKKNGIELIEGEGALAGAGQGHGRRQPDRSQDDRPRHRLGQAADPGHAVRRAGDRHRGGVGASASCRRRSRSSAPARRAPRSPPRTRGWGPRWSCSRRSTGCCRPRTRTSPSSSSGGSSGRG